MKITYTLLLSLILNIYSYVNVYAQQGNTFSKDEIISLYNKLYISSEIDSIIWNGQTQKCMCGTLENEIYKKAEDRVNFFRLACGLNEVKINQNFNFEAQSAALLVKANNQLTHYPTQEMKCYNQSSANGCQKSCLGFTDFKNFKEASFITGFIDDFGVDNYFVGHRKWILYTKLIEFGYGATDNSEALLTTDGVSDDSINLPQYIAYPWNGYVPINLIFPKWSFSIPQDKNVDFSQATVTMYDSDGRVINTVKLQEKKNFLDHTIVWTAKGLFTDYDINYGKNRLEENGFLDKKIRVLIKYVKIDGINKQFEYFVELIKI